ncbi:MAG: CDP-alcohol phosphatidyltransferase family protein [Pelistega sp.]|nr:CDP-alcohol phosphatidyltransferase family protein [Pelistega sp.]
MNPEQINRRPLASRGTRWAQAIAAYLARLDVPTPNQISILSIFFALIAFLILVFWPTIAGLICVALCIQLRLLCNLFDGMVALEGGKKTSSGPLYNEIPDRVADTFFIIGLGYCIDQAWLGYLGALFAMATAYLRTLGGSLGLPQRFTGPMAKPHRMALLTGACLMGALESHLWHSDYALWVAAIGIALGSLLTCYIRTRDIAAELRLQAQGENK